MLSIYERFSWQVLNCMVKDTRNMQAAIVTVCSHDFNSQVKFMVLNVVVVSYVPSLGM